jgi:integrase
MREGEIFALTWANIDLENAQLFVEATLTEDENGKLVRTEPKTDASKRVVALSPKTVEALRDHRRNTAGFQGYVFTTGDGVSPLRKSNFISRDFRPLLKRAGLPPITFHSLRHVANSVLLKHGASPLEAAERLGHTDTRMTLDTYGHVLSGSQTALASRLDEMFDLGQVRPNEHAQ